MNKIIQKIMVMMKLPLIYNCRPSLGVIKIQDLHGVNKKLKEDSERLWFDLNKTHITNKRTYALHRKCKQIYSKIVRNEATYIHIKILLQQINLGLDILSNKELKKAIFPEIFKLAEYKNRVQKLNSLTQVGNKEVGKVAIFGPAWVEKEIKKLNKLIDKSQYKINEFNKEVKIDVSDLTDDISEYVLKLVA